MGRAHADQRRAAHLHRLDADRRVLDRRPADERQLVRQPRLVDDLDRVAVGREPDRPHRHAVDQHPPTVWTWPTPWTPPRSRTASGGARGASSTQCEGAAPASDWLAWEQAGQAPAVRRRQRLRHPLRRGLRRARRARPHPPPPLDRVGPHRARARAGATPRRSSTTSRCSGRRGTPASSRGSACTTSRCPGWFAVDERGFVDAAGPHRTTGPATSTSWPRPSATSSFGWKPVNEPSAYALLGWRLGLFPPGVSDAERFAEALEAIHLAAFEAALRLRETGKPVASIHNLSPVVAAEPTARRRGGPRPARPRPVRACGSRRCATASSPCRAARRSSATEFRTAFDLIGFSYYNALVDRPRTAASARTRPTPGAARWATRRGARASAWCSTGWPRTCPARRCSSCEHGIGTDDDGWRAEFLRESLGFVAAGRRRRHRPPRVLPLDRGRQLRVDLRLHGPLRPVRRRTARRSPAPRCCGRGPECRRGDDARSTHRQVAERGVLLGRRRAARRSRSCRSCFMGPGTDLDGGAVIRSGRAIVEDLALHAVPGARRAGARGGGRRCSSRSRGTVGANLGSLLAAIGCAAALAALLRHEGVGRPGLVTAVVVANPWFLIAATSTVDFLWALALLLAAAWLLRTDRRSRRASPPRSRSGAVPRRSRWSPAWSQPSCSNRTAAARRRALLARRPSRPPAALLVFVPSFRASGDSLAFAQNDVPTSSFLVQLGRFAREGPVPGRSVRRASCCCLASRPLARTLVAGAGDWIVRFARARAARLAAPVPPLPVEDGPPAAEPRVPRDPARASRWRDRPRLLAALVVAQLLYARRERAARPTRRPQRGDDRPAHLRPGVGRAGGGHAVPRATTRTPGRASTPPASTRSGPAPNPGLADRFCVESGRPAAILRRTPRSGSATSWGWCRSPLRRGRRPTSAPPGRVAFFT